MNSNFAYIQKVEVMLPLKNKVWDRKIILSYLILKYFSKDHLGREAVIFFKMAVPLRRGRGVRPNNKEKELLKYFFPHGH